jgi:hypothetical protein
MKKKRLLTYRGESEMTADMWEKGELVRLLKGAPGTQYQEANDTDKTIMRDWVKSLLNKQEITVRFVKADWETEQREIAYWRKHPNLHGWMQQLAESKNLDYGTFNGVELELTWKDLDELERAIRHRELPNTSGFFFGDPADDIFYEKDLEFIKAARAELFLGLKVFYNSSW